MRLDHSQRFLRTLLLATVAISLTPLARADTAIETETAQIGARGEMNISNSLEFEKGTDGNAMGTLTQFEYGITDRCEILIEPFFQQWEFPKDGESLHGAGDLEITPSYEIVLEKDSTPAILLATKIKVPTGKSPDFSTGKFDYLPYVIVGKHFGGWTMNANLGVDFITKSVVDGETIEPGHKQFTWDLEFEREIFKETTWFVEAFSAEEGLVSGSTALEYELNEHLNVFAVASYNEDKSYIFRTGFNIPIGKSHAKED